MIPEPTCPGSQRFPTFLGIGAQKSGTSWLAYMIGQHPSVCMAIEKEVDYFSSETNYSLGLDWYQSQFKFTENVTAVGEYSPNYFWSGKLSDSANSNACQIPHRVHSCNPQMKLILTLRNPVDRAISAYYHHIRKGRLSANVDIRNVLEMFGIQSMGFYASHLTSWLEYFSMDDFLILVYEEDLKENCQTETLERVFQHIEVDVSFRPKDIAEKVHERASHFQMRTRSFPTPVRQVLRKFAPSRLKNSKFWDIPVHEDSVRYLREFYEPHNEKLERLLGRKLPW